jgi:hypothetical protein
MGASSTFQDRSSRFENRYGLEMSFSVAHDGPVLPIFPFGVARATAPLLETLLAHRRERRVLLAGGARAEAERRQAAAEIEQARARIAVAEAALAEELLALQRQLAARFAGALRA